MRFRLRRLRAEQLAGELARRSRTFAVRMQQRRVKTRACCGPAVLQVVGARSLRRGRRCNEVAHEAGDQLRALECGRLVRDSYPDPAEPGMRAGIPPDTRVVRHDAEANEALDPRFPHRVTREAG